MSGNILHWKMEFQFGTYVLVVELIKEDYILGNVTHSYSSLFQESGLLLGLFFAFLLVSVHIINDL